MTELLDTNTLIKRLRHQGRQYAAGQASRGKVAGRAEANRKDEK